MDGIVEICADGSLRRFFRINDEGLILIRPAKGPMGVPEQKAYFNIGRHLSLKGVSVPGIKAFDEETGDLWVEDVGETSLYDLVHRSGPRRASNPDISAAYELAVKQLVLLGVEGIKGFDPGWCHDTPFYDALFAAKREALYFTRFFLVRYMGHDREDLLERELIEYARKIDDLRRDFLIHRDYQSRNLMLRGHTLYVIDFQGAMVGPLFYDLAALLNDPYVNLEDGLKKRLFELYLQELRARGVHLDLEGAETQFKTVSLFRLLQVLGAFAFLTMERNRPFFKQFIPVAVERLRALLIDDAFLGLPTLKSSLNRLGR